KRLPTRTDCRSRPWFWSNGSNRSRFKHVLWFANRCPMNNILGMKTVRIPFPLVLCALTVLLVELAQAAPSYRYAQYRVPQRHVPPAGNQTNQAKPAVPQEKPVKFKDLPLNSEFYF